MNTKTWMLAGLMMSMALMTGCNGVPGDGTAVEGKWTGSLAELLAVTETELPIAVKPDAEFLFDNGDLTVTIRPDIFLVGWMFRVVIDGSYSTDDSTSLDKMTMSLASANIKFLFFKIPVMSLGLASQCIYKIEEQNTLYIIPGFDLLPEAAQDECEAHPENIDWTGITIDDVTYKPLTLTRDV